MIAYYNEIDPFKAEVLREAIKAGAIAPGDVDERSIADVQPAELMGYTQCHFFAGGGFWSRALRNAGWPDSRPVWTGSCPCPSFSVAGKGEGFADPRHLWPHWYRLIRECRPPAVFGEQVAAAIGHGWLDLVCGDLEASGYAIAPAVLGAHSVGAPHIRQRLYFVAESSSQRHDWGGADETSNRENQAERLGAVVESERSRNAGILGDATQRRLGMHWCAPGSGGHAAQPSEPIGVGIAHSAGLKERELHAGSIRQADGSPEGQKLESGSDAGRLAQPVHPERRSIDEHGSDGCDRQDSGREEAHGVPGARGEICWSNPLNGFWRDADWIGCRDGKFRPVKPGSFPLAHGYPARVGLLRIAGDAICVPAAQEFITAYLESEGVTA